MKRFLWMSLLLIALPFTASAESPDFSGEWVLNPALSDDVASVMAALRPNNQSRGGGMKGGRGGGGGGGRGGGRGGGMSSDQQPEGKRPDNGAMIKEMKAATARLSIFHEDIELNVTDGMGLSRLFQCDGSLVQVWSPRGQQQAQANWAGESLKITYEAPKDSRKKNGGRTDVYTIEDGRLIVTRIMTMPSGGDPVPLRFVYERENENSRP